MEYFSEFEQLLSDSQNTCQKYQRMKYMHITEIAKYFLLCYEKKGTTVAFNIGIVIFLIGRIVFDFLYHVRAKGVLEHLSIHWAIQAWYVAIYFNTMIIIPLSLYRYLMKGIYSLQQKYMTLIKFSNMICQKNQRFQWQVDEQNISSTIDFLDIITITSYGKLRKILLDFGKRYTHRMQVVYGAIFSFIFFIVIFFLWDYILSEE